MRIIQADIFGKRVRGWFTEKSTGEINPDGVIPGLNCGTGTRAPGGEVEANRLLLYTRLGVKPANVATARQVHGSRVEPVMEGGEYPDTDALVTDRPGLTLAIQVADCAALLLADPGAGVVAAVHAGWRGAVAGIVPAAAATMSGRFGASRERIRAWISPCIGQARFEVGEEVAVRFPDRFVDRRSFEKPHVDLSGFLNSQLEEEGVYGERISVEKGCTWEESSRFYSWRREGQEAGRMMALICLGDTDTAAQ